MTPEPPRYVGTDPSGVRLLLETGTRIELTKDEALHVLYMLCEREGWGLTKTKARGTSEAGD